FNLLQQRQRYYFQMRLRQLINSKDGKYVNGFVIRKLEERNQWLLHMFEVIYASEINKLEMKRRANQSEHQRISLQLDVHSDTFAIIVDEVIVTSSNRVTHTSRPEPVEKETNKYGDVTEIMSQQAQPTRSLFSQDLEATQGIDSVQKEILAKIKNSKLIATSQGIDFYSILQLMSNRFNSENANELHMHLQQLVDFGYLFNTVDSQHFKFSRF
ncbi:hypothetical protein RFI_36983, partial [Reticulomyxa filosa]